MAQKRNEAVKRIEREIDKIKDDLNGVKASPDFSNKVLYPLQEVRKAIEIESVIPNISYRLEGFWDKLEQALEKNRRGEDA